MFDTTSNLFSQYTFVLSQSEHQDFQKELWTEVDGRLWQINFLYKKVYEVMLEQTLLQERCKQHTIYIHSLERGGKEDPNIHFDKNDAERLFLLINEIKLYTESFYYFSFRIRSALRNKENNFPGLSNFECEGIRNVRNHLIEHPEGNSSRRFSTSWEWDNINGPKLKVENNDRHSDAGLKANAIEFRDGLENLLKGFLGQL